MFGLFLSGSTWYFFSTFNISWDFFVKRAAFWHNPKCLKCVVKWEPTDFWMDFKSWIIYNVMDFLTVLYVILQHCLFATWQIASSMNTLKIQVSLGLVWFISLQIKHETSDLYIWGSGRCNDVSWNWDSEHKFHIVFIFKFLSVCIPWLRFVLGHSIILLTYSALLTVDLAI